MFRSSKPNLDSQKTPMSAVDTAWLRMDSPTNLMMIGVVLIFDSPIDTERLKQTLEKRLLVFDRFKQQVVVEQDKAYWVNDPLFDIDSHLHIAALPNPNSESDLQTLASDLYSQPLSFSKPLWQMHLIQEYKSGSALIIRIHHCIADGIALIRVLLSLTDDEANPAEQEEAHHHRLIEPSRNLLRNTFKFGQSLIEEGRHLLNNPELALDLARKSASAAGEIKRIGLMPPDPKTLFKGDLSGHKRVAWSTPIALSQVKELAIELNGTINDVLLTCAAGAIRHFMKSQQKIIERAPIHLAVPFNLRPLDQPVEQLGNQFGLVIVALPIGLGDPLARFSAVKKHMDELKHSYQAQVFFGLLDILGKGPSILEKTALELLSQKASAVMTNVPGPKKAVYLAGSKLSQPLFWVPQSGEVGIGLSILSYDDRIQFGIVADKNLIPNPNQLSNFFEHSFIELSKHTIQTKN